MDGSMSKLLKSMGDLVSRRCCGKTGLFVVVLVAILAGSYGTWRFAGDRDVPQTERTGNSVADFDIETIQPQVITFCGDCHAVPGPETFPKSAWYDEVKRGYQFYYDSGRTDLDIPPMQEVVKYFRSQAPEALLFPGSITRSSPGPLKFQRTTLDASQNGADSALPAVSFVNWVRLENDRPASLLFCDMRSGEVRSVSPTRSDPHSTLLATLVNPAHVEPCDLDQDGRLDLVVADLGSFLPEDHNHGRVVWLRRDPAADSFEPVVIQQDLGRVADVQPGDFDGDGDLDLVVAVFGYINTGQILLLVNEGIQRGQPRFRLQELDGRHGAVHVPVADLNKDGRLDFIALIAQEHEVIEAFLNQGEGRFRRELIFAADDPSFGSSGIQLVDLDQDGDLDVLYTNGDTFDSLYVKPYHGIRWLENRGTFPFVSHPLTIMPGVHRALAGDLDGDGDLDIVAVALLPEQLVSKMSGRRFDSVIWLEQTTPGRFERHSLESAACNHPALALADFDGDGAPDLAVGNFREKGDNELPQLIFWWNSSKGAPR
jgi:hypothetical protein